MNSVNNADFPRRKQVARKSMTFEACFKKIILRIILKNAWEWTGAE